MIHLLKNSKQTWCGVNRGKEWSATYDVARGTCPACFEKVPEDNMTDGEKLAILTAPQPREPLAHWQLVHLECMKDGLLTEIDKLVKEVEKLKFTPEGADTYWAMSYLKDAARAARLNFRKDLRNLNQ